MKTMQRNPPETLFHNVWVKKQQPAAPTVRARFPVPASEVGASRRDCADPIHLPGSGRASIDLVQAAWGAIHLLLPNRAKLVVKVNRLFVHLDQDVAVRERVHLLVARS